ncbi:tRNA guanosine(34) transglycosylase Tgt [Candidatus Falkowbacteria bacterium]|nr:tRNA guanosine(34) transglycosylase Tgt [Candidatus Falkowbacteria bacterium]
MKNFSLIKSSGKSKARVGKYKTAHGVLHTPFFMPVATQGVLKHVTAEEIRQLGAEIILSNTYHLMLRPGSPHVKKMGGLHSFADWQGSILTDSGGFQVFSLAGTKKRSGDGLVKVTDDGVEFRSYVDGSKHLLTPERALRIQAELGVDIAVCLDQCVALPADDKKIRHSVEITTKWAERTKKELKKIKNKPLVHAVIQGGLDLEMRKQSLAELAKLDFDGYNIGGLAVGETSEQMNDLLAELTPLLPADRPRYLMGVGYPEQIVHAVRQGVDMFDCVIPTREGRHGRLFQRNKKIHVSKGDKFYETINITNSKFASSKRSINPDSKIPALRKYTLGYLNYLFKINEPLGLRLATLNNLEFYLDLMSEIRQEIKNGKL